MKNFEIGNLITWGEMFDSMDDVPTVKKRIKDGDFYKSIEYLNVPCTFDIEVSSFYDENEQKRSIQYIWQLCFNGNSVIGRGWKDFLIFFQMMINKLNLNDGRYLVIYIRNLAYEFQFLKDYFEWNDVFAREKRSPMKAISGVGIELRCSYMLSGCSLETTGKNLTKYKVKKKIGALDYDKIRTPETPIEGYDEWLETGIVPENSELDYCVSDVVVDCCYIQEELERYGSIAKIPMTNTGKVREYCREKCFENKNYKKLISDLKIESVEEYELLKEAFQGGFTHASHNKAGNKVWENVQSWDFTSSYPTVMVAEKKFPISKGMRFDTIDIETIENNEDFVYIFLIELEDINEKFEYEHILSFSKCFDVIWDKDEKESTKEKYVDNGRIIKAHSLKTVLTSIDWMYLKEFYSFGKITVHGGYAYRAGYLPTDFVRCVLDFYNDKTSLKDVLGMEAEYMLKKGMLNSCYGMTVTDIINDSVYFSNSWIYDVETENFFQWSTDKISEEEQLEKYNNSRNRFLYYTWGVVVTALSRANLYRGILECGSDYIYADTDSIKILNREKHMDFINSYNKEIINKLEKACEFHGFDKEEIQPKTVDGKKKPLGVWDDDGFYLRFKTLGAKRYLVEKDEYDKKTGETKRVIKATIAGSNKKKTSKYISEQENPFEFFNDEMTIDEEHSGRMIVTYLDIPMKGVVKDYLGNEYHYNEKSGIHMEKSEYTLSLTPLYLAYLGANMKPE